MKTKVMRKKNESLRDEYRLLHREKSRGQNIRSWVTPTLGRRSRNRKLKEGENRNSTNIVLKVRVIEILSKQA